MQADVVDGQLLEWRKEQKEYIAKYCPEQKVKKKKQTDLIFGNPANEMKQFPYSMFNKLWIRMLELCGEKLKPYAFRDRSYTPFRLRSTYICNLSAKYKYSQYFQVITLHTARGILQSQL